MPTCERARHTAGDPPLPPRVPWKEARGKERPCCPPTPGERVCKGWSGVSRRTAWPGAFRMATHSPSTSARMPLLLNAFSGFTKT